MNILNIRHNPGLFISGIIHILIMAIPVSFAVVQKFGEIELFVITEEMSSVRKQEIPEKTLKVSRVLSQKTKNMEEPLKIEEHPEITEEKVIEPILITDKRKDIALPLAIADPLEKASPAPQSFASTGTSGPRDVEFGTATGPKFLHRRIPVYPLMARKLGKEGVVVLRLAIDHRGNLLNVEVTERAGYGFTEAAIEAVKRSTFLPAKRDGQPIISHALLPIRFMLRRD
ncbi:MAG: TonB family protein [Syntrophales bacterium]|nr:TonB family protein [Syntrophales bacterium]